MRPSKDVVAFHEAGHAVVILNTPIRDFIQSAAIFLVDGDWYGEVRLTGDRSIVDPHWTFEIAKSIAGPLAQLIYYPESVAPEIRQRWKATGSLISTFVHLRKTAPTTQTSWGSDLKHWLPACFDEAGPQVKAAYAIEAETTRFLKHDDVAKALRDFSTTLTVEEKLSRPALLEFSPVGLPPPRYPNTCKFIS